MHYLSETLSWLGYLMKLKEEWKMKQDSADPAKIILDTGDELHLAYCTHCHWRHLTNSKKGAWQLGGEHLLLAHDLHGKQNNAQINWLKQKSRIKLTPLAENLTAPLGSALQAASSRRAASSERADLRQAAINTYPQIYAHVDN
jgi:hypothetical protein